MSNKRTLAAVSFLTAIYATITLVASSSTINYSNAMDPATTTTVKIHAGGGNSTNMLAAFVPQQVQISVGQSVTWDNPSPVPEPHTVTFVLNGKTMTTGDVPFTVRNSTRFMPVPSGANSQPTITPGKNGINTIIGSNVRSYYPTLIDSNGHAKVLRPNGTFTITGNEQYVNSGWLLPKTNPLYPNASNTFTVTFQKAGTYNYLCEIHPWMAGIIVVK